MSRRKYRVGIFAVVVGDLVLGFVFGGASGDEVGAGLLVFWDAVMIIAVL